MAPVSENFLSEDKFEDVLTTFYCYGNTSEAVKKIATSRKDYHKSSLGIIVLYIAKAHHQ